MTIARSNAHIKGTESAALVLPQVFKVCGGCKPYYFRRIKIWHDQLVHPRLDMMRQSSIILLTIKTSQILKILFAPHVQREG